MCRACLSWTNCVTAAGWQELMISVAATGLMHLKAMLWCWRAGGGCQRVWNRGERKSTALDLAVVQLTTVSTALCFYFLWQIKKHTSIYPRLWKSMRGVKLMMSGSQQAEAHPHDHPILWRLGQFIREFIVWLLCSPQAQGKGTMLVCLYQCSILS